MKKLIIVLFILLYPTCSFAAVGFVTSISAQSSDQNSVTTGSLDTTGATMLVAIIACGQPSRLCGSITDNKGNTWVKASFITGGGNPNIAIFYSTPGSGSVGVGHTFSFTCNQSFPSIVILAFNGTQGSTLFDKENGVTAAVASVNKQPGSISPNQSNELFITGIGWASTVVAPAIDSSFTIKETNLTATANAYAISTGYKIQTTANAENPIWSWTNSVANQTSMVAFKPQNISTLVTIFNGLTTILNSIVTIP